MKDLSFHFSQNNPCLTWSKLWLFIFVKVIASNLQLIYLCFDAYTLSTSQCFKSVSMTKSFALYTVYCVVLESVEQQILIAWTGSLGVSALFFYIIYLRNHVDPLTSLTNIYLFLPFIKDQSLKSTCNACITINNC